MSILYLPNGGRLVMNGFWKSSTHPSGHTVLTNEENKLLAEIHTSGLVHVVEGYKHTYYPPGTNLDNAIALVEREIEKLPYYKLERLKNLLKNYNCVTHRWKK